MSGGVLPEGEAAPAEGQGVVAGGLPPLVVGLVAPQLVARLTVAQVGLGVLAEVAVWGAEGHSEDEEGLAW